jgi:hypothetical protein
MSSSQLPRQRIRSIPKMELKAFELSPPKACKLKGCSVQKIDSRSINLGHVARRIGNKKCGHVGKLAMLARAAERHAERRICKP